MNAPSLNEINKTANMDPNLITKHYKLKLMQSEIASQLNISPPTIQRQRKDINLLSPYRINPSNVKKRPKKAKIDNIGDLKNLKRLQMTSRQLQTIIIRKEKEKII